ncbi:MAG TPA: ABC transporter substrate-binding protein [Desulfobacteraceae bacterium]|nr:ABC transporter substrate-binding protein [Desulfobacteraceae bacterium]
MRTNVMLVILVILLLAVGCDTPPPSSQSDAPRWQPEPLAYHPLPDNITWITNDSDPAFSSPKAVKGGMLRSALPSFPMTFRVVGPDSNGGFRSNILDNQLSLLGMHPNTRNPIPELATHWAYGEDKKTMYFKLDPAAKWSDGHPVTARDFIYTLTFMRSKKIIAPWYNDYYTREIESVVAFDDHTIAVKSTKAVPDLHLKLAIGPIPAHFYKELSDDFTAAYNWAVVPNTGPYQISEFKKGRYIRFERKKNWWAAQKKYFKHRFNVDTVKFTVIRDANLSWEYFKKGRLDAFGMTLPKYWHVKSKTPVIENGYVKLIWFYNDLEQPSYGMWLNQDKPVFKDQRLRLAFAHAMNVDKVIQKVLRGDYLRLPQAFFGYGEYTDYSIKARSYDIEKVHTLMTDAGWQRGYDGVWTKGNHRFSAKVTYYTDEHMPRLAVLKEEALKAGIELRLEKLDPSAAFKKILEKQHEVAWMGWSTNVRPSYWQGWHSDNAHAPQTNNITNTDNPELDRLIDQYRDSLDKAERIRLSKTIQRKIHDIAAYVPTYMVPYVRTAYWRWMKLPEFHGTRSTDQSMFDPFSSAVGGLFWIDEHVRKETRDAMKAGLTFPKVRIIDKRYKPEAL